jgi:hypothetical protein
MDDPKCPGNLEGKLLMEEVRNKKLNKSAASTASHR